MVLKPRRVGIVDIAQEAGVSKAAVSYALNGTGRLDASTRDRIIQIAKDLGYQANFAARNLRKSGTGLVAMGLSVHRETVAGAQNISYFMEAWQGALEVALRRDYLVILVPSQALAPRLSGLPFDGAIVLDPSANDPMLELFLSAGVPAVTIGVDPERQLTERLGLVDSPHAEIAKEAFALFRARGAKRIALIQGSADYFFNRVIRQAYRADCSAFGQEEMIADVGLITLSTTGHDAMAQLLQAPSPPDAVFAGVDRLAVGALHAAEQAGLRVPDDLLIASGSDGVTKSAAVPITSAELHPADLGRAAMAMLLDNIIEQVPMREVLIPGSLDERASTAGFIQEK